MPCYTYCSLLLQASLQYKSNQKQPKEAHKRYYIWTIYPKNQSPPFEPMSMFCTAGEWVRPAPRVPLATSRHCDHCLKLIEPVESNCAVMGNQKANWAVKWKIYNVKHPPPHTHTHKTHKKFSLVPINVKKRKTITRLYLRFYYLNIVGVG